MRLPRFSLPAAVEFATYGQMFRMKASDKLTTLALYFCAPHLPHMYTNVCVVCGCTHTRTVHLQLLQRGAQRVCDSFSHCFVDTKGEERGVRKIIGGRTVLREKKYSVSFPQLQVRTWVGFL